MTMPVSGPGPEYQTVRDLKAHLAQLDQFPPQPYEHVAEMLDHFNQQLDKLRDAGVTFRPTAVGSPKPVVTVSVPLRQGPQSRYVLRAIILTESVDRVLVTADLPQGWVAGVTDSRGTLLARSVRPEAFVG